MHGWKKKLDRELDEFVRNMPSEFAPAGQEAATKPEQPTAAQPM